MVSSPMVNANFPLKGSAGIALRRPQDLICPPIAYQDSKWWASTPRDFAHQLHNWTTNRGQAHHGTLPINCITGQQWWANTPQEFAHQLHTKTAMVDKHTTGILPPIAHQDSNGGQTHHMHLLTNCTPRQQWWENTPQEFAHK